LVEKFPTVLEKLPQVHSGDFFYSHCIQRSCNTSSTEGNQWSMIDRHAALYHTILQDTSFHKRSSLTRLL